MLKNCGNCEHINVTGRPGSAMAGCSKTGFVVPHSWDGDINEFIFWRVPIVCPLDASAADKTDSMQPKKTWTIRTFDSFQVS